MSALLLDIGNSFVEAAIWTPDGLTILKRFPTEQLQEKLAYLSEHNTDQIIVSSVVPTADSMLRDHLAHNTPIHMITWQTIPTLTLNITTPEQVGADRLVNALAAYHHVKDSVLVIDCGTATTCCYVDQTGTYQGGAIFPGLGLASQALHDHTAKIPLVFVQAREELLGKNTIDAVQSGLYHSCIFALNGFIAAIKKQDPSVTIVGTGKGLEFLKDKLDLDYFDTHLIFQGLGICAEALINAQRKTP
jgi:type III pantothenate kinase